MGARVGHEAKRSVGVGMQPMEQIDGLVRGRVATFARSRGPWMNGFTRSDALLVEGFGSGRCVQASAVRQRPSWQAATLSVIKQLAQACPLASKT
jgi:hypothetical protein